MNSSSSGSPRNGILGHFFARWRFTLMNLAAANQALQIVDDALSFEIAELKNPVIAVPSGLPSTTRKVKRKKGKK